MSGFALRVDERADDTDAVLRRLVEDRVAERLAAKDHTLWGPEAESEASIRLGWVDLPVRSRSLLAEIEALQAELRQEGLDHIVLAGMGGSSLAPEVVTRTAGVELTVLDTTDPGVVRRALADRLDRTVVVVSSKSGSTVETDSQRRAYLRAFDEAGIDGRRRIVVVTDPGSPLAELATEEGYRRVFLADPNVGGRYSALSAFGLVPSALAGADIAELLDDAEAVLQSLATPGEQNPALAIGAVLGAAHAAGKEKVVIGTGSSTVTGFAAWAEQLIAESTGKNGRGLLPVDVGGTSSDTPGWLTTSDATYVSIGAPESGTADIVVDGPLGTLFQVWETAIAVAGRVIDINPFDQPNVEAAKKQARALLDDPGSGDGLPHAFTEGPVEVYGTPEVLGGRRTLEGLVGSLRSLAPANGYLSLQAYLDRDADADVEQLRPLVAASSGLQTTFGWGP
ncbi:MAG TPA: glucose-6-phosphate isomerase, partial [Actinopolymorphaceae bacterium]